MKSLLTAAALLALLASSAFAQISGPQTSSSAPATTGSTQNLAAAQKISQDLKDAGFTDIKVVAESFVVQAKSKDGDPVLMTIGPHGMSVFEAMNTGDSGSASGSTTGAASGSSMKSESKK